MTEHTSEDDRGLALRLLAETAWRGRRRLALLAAGIMLPALALALAMSPRYVSTSTMVLLLGPEYTVQEPAGSNAAANLAFDPDHILGNESAILDSEDLHRAVIRRIGIARLYPDLLKPDGVLPRLIGMLTGIPDALARLVSSEPATPRAAPDPIERALVLFDAKFDAEPSKLASVLTLRFTHKDPAVAQATLRTIEALYLERRRTLYLQVQTAAMRDQASRARAALEAADRQLAAFRAARDIPDYATQLDIMLREVGDIGHDATDARRTASANRARIAALTAEAHGLPAMVSGGSDSDMDAHSAPLRADLEALRARDVATLSRYQAGSDQARDLASQIAARDGELRAMRGNRPLSSQHTVRNAAADTVAGDLLQVRSELGATSARIEADDAAQASVQARIRMLDENERQLTELTAQRDVRLDDWRAASASLAAQEGVEAIEAKAVPGARIASAPNLPMHPKPLRLLILAAGLVLSLVAVAAAVLLGNTMRRTILFGDELDRLGIGLLATIPRGDRLASLGPILPVMI